MYKESSDLLNILGMVGIALLTVMIPIAVAIFSEKEKEKDYEVLDRNVMLEYVIEAQFLLRYLALIYVPLIFWVGFPSSPLLFKFAYLFFWGWGVLGILRIIIKSYRWIKEDRFDFRFKYLQELNNSKDMKKPWRSFCKGIADDIKQYWRFFRKIDKADDMKKPWRSFCKGIADDIKQYWRFFWKIGKADDMNKSWRSFWDVDKTDSWEERRFFGIFSSTIGNFLQGDIEKIQIASRLVDDFNSFIDKRSVIFLVVYDEVFPKILKWHFSIWQKGYQMIGEKKYTGWGDYNALSMSLSFTLNKVQERALKENQSYSFFTAFKSHVEKYKKDFVKNEQGENYKYLDGVILDFFDTLVKNSENRLDIWDNFPDEWKITSENMKKQENVICGALYNKFLDWAGNRIIFSNKSEYDTVWDNFVRGLFPSVCPLMWADIFTFLMRGWESGNRMKSLIEKPRNFGGVGRISFGWVGDDEESKRKMMEDDAKQRKAEEEETIALALCIRRAELAKVNLKDFIAELKAMEGNYKDKNDEDIEIRRKRYIDIFGKLLEARCEMSKRKIDAEK